ncbi:MAG: DUF3823 domain-containing protein [Bacteroidales bacterium]|nr:DUF3823 domain-containing protein [Bacteroidales bacterium]
MKRIFKTILVATAAISMASCSLFEIDNYDAPEETLFGKVVDENGNPVLTDQGSEGIRVRLIETSWEGNVTPQDFYCRPDGSFTNTKLFEADYNIRVDGPFIPIVREATDGSLLADESVNTHIKGKTEVNFTVQPFLNVEITEIPQASGGKINAKVKVTRNVSADDFKTKIEPMGDYSDDFVNVTDIQLFVSYSSSVGYRARDDRWSNSLNYEGNSFEQLLGTEVQISSNGAIPSGRKVYVRAAARINYATEGTRRWNYSEPIEVYIP